MKRERTPLLPCILAMFLLTGPLAATENTSPKDRAKWRMATRAAARQVLDDLTRTETADDDDIAIMQKALTDGIAGDIDAHASRQKSRNICEEIVRANRRSAINQSLLKAVADASQHSPLPVSADDVRKALGDEWGPRTDASVSHFMKERFSGVYHGARQTAVAMSRQQLDREAALPPQADLDALLQQRLADRGPSARLKDNDYAALKAWLETTTAPADRPALEEMRTYVKEIGDRLLSEIRGQYRQQTEALEKGTKSEEVQKLIRADTIADALSQRVVDSVAQLRRERSANGRLTYSIFGCIQTNINASAKRLEQERFVSFMKQSAHLAIAPDRLHDLIQKDLPRCKRANSSQAFLTGTLLGATRKPLAHAYAAHADQASESGYFENALGQKGPIQDAFTKQVVQALKKSLPEARKRVSDAQFDRHFPSLREVQALDKKAIASVSDAQTKAIATADAAADFLTSGGYERIPRPSDLPLIEETEARLVAFASECLEEASAALKTQYALLQTMEKERRDALKSDIQNGASLKELTREWTKTLLSQWQEHIARTPSPYPDLLDPTQRELDKVLRQFYDSIEKELTEQPTEVSKPTDEEGSREDDLSDEIRQDPAQSEEVQQAEAGDEQAEKVSPEDQGENVSAAKVLSAARATSENQPDAVLLLADRDEEGLLATLISTSSGVSKTVEFDPRDAEASADAVFDSLKPQLAELLDSNSARWSRGRRGFLFFGKRSQPRLKMFVVIESNDVRHRMSLFLRGKIEEELALWAATKEGLPSPELDWKVGLAYAPIEEEE